MTLQRRCARQMLAALRRFAFVAFVLVADVAFGVGTRTINAVCNRVFLRRLLPLCAGCSPRILVPLRLVMGAMPAYAARCAALLNQGVRRKVGLFGSRIGVVMYADATRRLALRLMMDEGMTARGAVAELRRRGLRAPSERTARTWRAECLRGKSEPERQGFDVRVRREVVDVYLRTGDAAMAASMVGCWPATVYTWRTRLYGGRKERAMAADAGRRAGGGDGVKELRARCERLEFENRLLKVQNDILKGVGPRDLTNMEKTRAVHRMHERHGYPLAHLFAAVGLARATYHRLMRRLGEPSREDLATPLVHEAFVCVQLEIAVLVM